MPEPHSNSGAAPAPAVATPPPDRPDPAFEVIGAEVIPRSAVPTLGFEIAISDESGIPIQFVALTVLITIEPGARGYDAETRERLVELFGEPERWGSTTGAFRWTQVETVAGAFTGHGALRLAVECSYDHEIAATKFFGGITEGAYPLHFHFNGTIHYEGDDGRLQILPLAWDRSARFELPAGLWHEMISSHYPGGRWLRLSDETLEALGRRKARSGAPTMDDCIRGLLAEPTGSADPGGEA